MDLVRHYYAIESMTAPAFRLEYIYTYTHEPNTMRSFLISTTAFRALCETPQVAGVFISDSVRTVLAQNSEIALDFVEALVTLSKNGLPDARRGADCA